MSLNPSGSGNSTPVVLGTVRIKQLACAELLALLLAEDGSLYSLPYDTLQPHAVLGKLYCLILIRNINILYFYYLI